VAKERVLSTKGNTVALVRVSDFSRLWIGQSISMLGDAFTSFALPTLAILSLHATPVQMGLIAALGVLPVPLLSMVAGALADSMPRRAIMIVADLVRFVSLLAIVILSALKLLNIPCLYVIAVVMGGAAIVFGIAYQSLLPQIVDSDRLTDANTKMTLSSSIAGMLGKILGGSLVQVMGVIAAVFVDAVSYVVSVTSVALIRSVEQSKPRATVNVAQLSKEAVAGIGTVFGIWNVRWLICAISTPTLGLTIGYAVFLFYAYRVLHLAPGGLALAQGLGQIGFIGALVSTRVQRCIGLRATLASSTSLIAIGSAGVLFAQLGSPYLVVFLAQFVIALALPIFNITVVSYLQVAVGADRQGRTFAAVAMVQGIVAPVGSLLGGYLGSTVGIPITIALSAVVSAAGSLWPLLLREENSQAIGVPTGIGDSESAFSEATP
jgi:MFS family permease